MAAAPVMAMNTGFLNREKMPGLAASSAAAAPAAAAGAVTAAAGTSAMLVAAGGGAASAAAGSAGAAAVEGDGGAAAAGCPRCSRSCRASGTVSMSAAASSRPGAPSHTMRSRHTSGPMLASFSPDAATLAPKSSTVLMAAVSPTTYTICTRRRSSLSSGTSRLPAPSVMTMGPDTGRGREPLPSPFTAACTSMYIRPRPM
mmetsp:Transcript_20300/g.51405  ORF Transcript_20300/g.51405 Transcript_20300/m.51405 type:complete len:201 (-) Transcript_20300:1213-1815(-)